MKRFAPGVWNPDDDPAELYYLPDDCRQANDVAAEHTGRSRSSKALIWEEAER